MTDRSKKGGARTRRGNALETERVRAQRVARAVKQFIRAARLLRSLGVTRSQRVIADYGEWVVATLYRGHLAESRTQTGWDVASGRHRFQVRTHAKAATNKAAWTAVSQNRLACSAIVVVKCNEELLIERIYRVPSKRIASLLARDGRLPWSALSKFELKPRTMPGFGSVAPLFAISKE